MTCNHTATTVSHMVTPGAAAVARRVKDAITEAEVSHQEIGALLGIHQVTLSRRLAGKRAFQSEELLAIAHHLHIPPSTFFPGSEDNTFVQDRS